MRKNAKVPAETKQGQEARASFAVAVRERRHRLGLSQEELAWRAGLHRTYVTDIERGARNLSLKSIERLATALQAPIAELFSPSSPAKPTRAAPAVDPMKWPCVDILLVEDNPDDVELSLQAFQKVRMQNRIHTLKDGEAALDFLFRKSFQSRDWQPDQPLVVLLDLNLPKLSGLEVLRRLRGDSRTMHLPVVVLTASDRSRDVTECRQLGCSFYIIKPLNWDNFSKLTPNLHLDWSLVGQPVANR
jgi:CheY-like chemotaxis protein